MAVVSREFLAEDAAVGARALIEYCYAQGWTDGLPVVPPIREFVDEFLALTDRDPAEVLMVQSHLDRACTVREVTINAVMAGCRPELPGTRRGGLRASSSPVQLKRGDGRSALPKC